jgi:hypothetical protein
MLLAFVIITGLTVLSVIIHLEGLFFVRRLTRLFRRRPRLGLSIIVLLSIELHVVEIGLFALVYFVSEQFLGLGKVIGDKVPSFLEYYYFSAETFTALGYGDVTTSGDLRLIAVSEPLVGLTLISWSGAYTFLAMQRFWGERAQQRKAIREASGRPA